MEATQILARLVTARASYDTDLQFATFLIGALENAGFAIVKKEDYEDAIYGRTRLPSGGYLSKTNWPR